MLNSEFRVINPDKGEIWVEARGAPEADPDGSTCWHGFLYDVTERKKDEAQLRQAVTVFNSTAKGVCITDAEAISSRSTRLSVPLPNTSRRKSSARIRAC